MRLVFVFHVRRETTESTTEGRRVFVVSATNERVNVNDFLCIGAVRGSVTRARGAGDVFDTCLRLSMYVWRAQRAPYVTVLHTFASPRRRPYGSD